MNYSSKLWLCIATFISFSCLGMMRQLIRDENGFRLSDGKQEQIVQPHFVDSLLKRMSPEQLQTFVEQGNRIRVIRLSNGNIACRAMVPGLGGGPVLAGIFYWATKATCYGAITGAAVTAAAATGGAAAAGAVGAVGAVATGGLSVAGGVVASGVGCAVGASATATAGVGMVTAAAASVGSIVAIIETASLAAGALGAMIPFF